MLKRMLAALGLNPGLVGLFLGIFMLVFLAVVVTLTLVTCVSPEAYASTARIKVTVAVTQPETGLRPQPDGFLQRGFAQTEFSILQSEIILDRVIDALNLNETFAKKFNIDGRLKTSESRTVIKRMLELRLVPNTDWIDIKVYSDEKLEAAKIANAIAEVYQTYRRNQRTSMLDGVADQYKKLTVELRTDLANKTDNPNAMDAKITETIARGAQLYLAKNAGIETESVEIIGIAVPGPRPVRPNKPLNIALGIIFGTFLGVLMAGTVVILRYLKLRSVAKAQKVQSPS